MDFSKLVSERYSVRKFKPQNVEKDKLDKILEAARVAPSAGNKRPIKMIVVQEKVGLNKVKKAAPSFGAPLVIIACGDTEKAVSRPADGHPFVDIDTSIATDHMMLQASALGLGTCWIGAFDPQIIREEFSIPDYLEPLNILYVGYADGEPLSAEKHEKLRISIEKIVVYETL